MLDDVVGPPGVQGFVINLGNFQRFFVWVSKHIGANKNVFAFGYVGRSLAGCSGHLGLGKSLE